jgi:hypothetical protein
MESIRNMSEDDYIKEFLRPLLPERKKIVTKLSTAGCSAILRLGNAVARFAPAIHRLSAGDERDSL